MTSIAPRTALALALTLQLALVLAVAAPRLAPRLFGDPYRLVVRPLDPIDPFRGAYVDLGYEGFEGGDRSGAVFVPLERVDGAWRGRGVRPIRPAEGPYIACQAHALRPRCGIESLFLSQAGARRVERELARGGAVARVKIDGAGRAALIGIERR